mmetsp:Transcript_15574/g.32147  ORF Transcript_15574/g.32147 Transcript_15574/m.32147 type:complete len:147 (-) Transcript_15574:639-1079(-)
MTPPIIRIIADALRMRNNSQIIIVIARLPPITPNRKVVPNWIFPYCSSNNFIHGLSMTILRISMLQNMEGDNNFIVTMVESRGGSIFWSLSWTNVQRAPESTLASTHRAKPRKTKLTSPSTVKNSPSAIIKITPINGQVMRSILNR